MNVLVPMLMGLTVGLIIAKQFGIISEWWYAAIPIGLIMSVFAIYVASVFAAAALQTLFDLMNK